MFLGAWSTLLVVENTSTLSILSNLLLFWLLTNYVAYIIIIIVIAAQITKQKRLQKLGEKAKTDTTTEIRKLNRFEKIFSLVNLKNPINVCILALNATKDTFTPFILIYAVE